MTVTKNHLSEVENRRCIPRDLRSPCGEEAQVCNPRTRGSEIQGHLQHIMDSRPVWAIGDPVSTINKTQSDYDPK